LSDVSSKAKNLASVFVILSGAKDLISDIKEEKR